jgi:hypothetical protein
VFTVYFVKICVSRAQAVIRHSLDVYTLLSSVCVKQMWHYRAINTTCGTHLYHYQSRQHHLRATFVTLPEPATPFAWHTCYTVRASNTTCVTRLLNYQSLQHNLRDICITTRASNTTCVTHLVHYQSQHHNVRDICNTISASNTICVWSTILELSIVRICWRRCAQVRRKERGLIPPPERKF